MSKKFKLSILTPEKIFFTGEVQEINTVTAGGGIGILPEHSPFVGLLTPTVTKVKLEDGSVKAIFTSTGLIKVTKNDVEMVVDACERPGEIDAKRAEEAKKRAEDRLKKQQDKKTDYDRAEIALQRALARMRTKGM